MACVRCNVYILWHVSDVMSTYHGMCEMWCLYGMNDWFIVHMFCAQFVYIVCDSLLYWKSIRVAFNFLQSGQCFTHPHCFLAFYRFFYILTFLSQTNTTQFVVILKVTHFASIMIVFFAQEIHWFYNACTFVLLITFIGFILGGQIYVWRRRACTPSILCCVYHYEPWLCWAYWATRQSQGSFQTSKLSLNDVPPQ